MAGDKKTENFVEIDIECVQKGMKSAEDVYNNYGTIVIRKGRELESKHLSQLKLARVTKIKVIPQDDSEKKERPIQVSDFPQYKEKFENARFMIVDDSKSVRLVMKAIIEEMGLKVIGAADNAVDAVDRALKLKPNYITLDISMPGGDGTEAIRPILNAMPDAKIIMVSTLGYQDRIVEALELGAVQFISKPFDREHLKRVIINTIVKN